MSMQHSFEGFSEKQRRVELKSVGNFVARAVLVESANQFSLEKLRRTQYSLKYFFRSHVDNQTYGKTLNWHVFPGFISFEVNGRLFILSIFNKFDIFESNFCKRCKFLVQVHFG